MLRVDIFVRADLRSRPGGDVVQAQSIARGLRDLGVDAEVVTTPRAGVDLIHALNLTRLSSSLGALRAAQARRVPYVLTPVWHSLNHMADFYGRQYQIPQHMFPIAGYLGAKELYYERSVSALPLIGRWRPVARHIVQNADALLVNSAEEANVMLSELSVRPGGEVQVAPNGASLSFSQRFDQTRDLTIVCGGRIEPRKNTLAICEAFLASNVLGDYRLVLAGAMPRGHRRYQSRVLSAVDHRRIEYVGEVGHGRMVELLQRATAVVQASAFETTGLVALEALFAGAQVAMTDRTYGEDYFKGWVHSVNPYDTVSIRTGMEACILDPLPAPDQRYFECFSWDAVARATLDCYEEVL